MTTPKAKVAASPVEKSTMQTLTIPAPNLRVLEVRITGETPYMQHRFSKKGEIQAKQEQGSTAKTKTKRDARDFEADYQAAFHRSQDGWFGIPASAFRNALISACRVVGFQMTKAKLSVFCLSDGQDSDSGEGLVRIVGEPEKTILYVRNDTGVIDLRARPMWRQWSATVRLRYDADQFTGPDIMNLLMRAGQQVGIGEGRPDSKRSAGMGYGIFTVDETKQAP